MNNLEPVQRLTTVEQITQQLRQRVLDGTFRPGDRLAEGRLADGFGVSRGPVREALQGLIQEGLLVRRQHRGVFVTQLTTDDIADIYLSRWAIERTAVRLVLRSRPLATIQELGSISMSMAAKAESGDWPAVEVLDLQFHQQLVAGAGSHRLSLMFEALIGETRICLRNLRAAYTDFGDLVSEHRALYEALSAGNEDHVCKLLDSHFRQAVRQLTEEEMPF